jgi:predicted nuclease with TOPRIM domain
MNDIIIALISAGSSIFVGALALIGVIVTNKKSNAEIERKLEIQQAVQNTKIDELTREVREHNNFARRMPAVENEIKHIHEDTTHLEKEIDHLRKYHERG